MKIIVIFFFFETKKVKSKTIKIILNGIEHIKTEQLSLQHRTYKNLH